ncbi:unnamed protein product [Urochloa decumbens]|uniref:Uncharacterized protein n=1 Tax=Urochloa decumbens TaxID=240449 RepID=A0ABC9APE1_9POAL
MVAILDAFASYIQKLLTEMAVNKVDMLLGVPAEIEKLERNMESLKDFLADAERKRITDKSVQRWVRKLKDAMYNATDIIDLCQLEADKRRESSQDDGVEEDVPLGCIQPMLFCLRNPKFAHKIASRIKELNQHLEDIYKEAGKFNFINLGSYQEWRMPTHAEHSNRKAMSEFDESAIVGKKIERDTRGLAQVLTNAKLNIQVVSIVGMGGIGKTILAQKIFKEATIQKHFKIKIWLSITQHFDENELLRSAIKHAGRDLGEERDMSLLVRTLTDTLSANQFLVVMDDMWSDHAWRDVLSVPIRNACQQQPGSRVVVTTRFEDLAKRMGACFHQHHVSPLNNEDAWSLLNKQLPPNQVVENDHLKDVGMKIIKKCGNLPLAVKVMGGLLSMKSQSESEWEAVLSHRAWSVDGLPKEIDNPIYLSYEDLSPELKQCFLYCSLLPKGTVIIDGLVTSMWISEGFINADIRSSDSDQLEETANQYYRELITRNLIEPIKEHSLTGYRCTMHDVVRSFAEFMVREEALLVAQDGKATGSTNNSLVRRMSVGPTNLVLEWGAILQKQVSLRTLIINCRINFKPGDSFTNLSRLRVFCLNGSDCDSLVDSLCRLRHLRYLSLENTNISRLPESIGRMKFLQHIMLRRSRNLEKLPRSIIELVHLRTINLINSNANIVIPKGLGGLTNLRKLNGFPVHMDLDGGWCSLEEIGPLSQLRCLTTHGLENVSSSSLAEKAKISSKENLWYLELNWSKSGSMGSKDEIEKRQQQRAAEEILEQLCPPSRIQDLIIQGYFGRRLPNWMTALATAAFKSLRYLTLQNLPCCTRLPAGLCRLPCLERLRVEHASAIKRVGPEFQAPSSLVEAGGNSDTTTSTVAFPHLTELRLDDLCEWEDWDWEEQGEDETAGAIAMAALKKLLIKKCKLSRLPPGLASSKRHTLRQLYLYELTNLIFVENFPSVMDLDVFDCPKLKRISGFPMLQKIRIFRCPNIEVLEDATSINSLELKDATMETLPGYLRGVKPMYLHLGCGKKLYESLVLGSSEWDKISHIKTPTIDCL